MYLPLFAEFLVELWLVVVVVVVVVVIEISVVVEGSIALWVALGGLSGAPVVF